MSAIDGIIILDPTFRPIITSHFQFHPPSYPLLHIDAFVQSFQRSQSSQSQSDEKSNQESNENGERESRKELDPILWVHVPGRLNQLDDGDWIWAGLCHVEKEGLRFLVPISQEGQSEL